MAISNHDVLIVGAGIGGLTLALQLHEKAIPCRIVEAAPELRPLGVGINILPHASRELHRLGLGAALDRVGVQTRSANFYNRFGQFVYSEAVGVRAGYPTPQYSIHRGDLQQLLMDAVIDRIGPDAVTLGGRLLSADQDEKSVTATVANASGTDVITAGVLVGCDGVHSAVRAQLYPDLQGQRYSGCTMWRGVTVRPPFLDGRTMVRAGWLESGKMVIYPIRDDVDGQGNQLINWVAELNVPQRGGRDWNREGLISDIIGTFQDWTFDWLDVADLIRSADSVLEYPMVDQEPLPRWSFGRITLLGDAAHPMVPRGSNGAGQAILDTRSLADQLSATPDAVAALDAYDDERREATGRVVLANRTNPPDAILREVWERTGDEPFDRVEDVIDVAEIEQILENYRGIAGYSLANLEV